MMLESIANILYFSHMEGNDAVFIFDNFSWIDNYGFLCKYNKLKVVVDLNEKILKDASADDRRMTAEEAMILIWEDFGYAINCFAAPYFI